MDIQGEYAFVTGGGSGLGAATVRQLAAAGARVLVLDRNEEAAAAVAKEAGGIAAGADVASQDDVEAAFAKAIKEFGQAPRIIVNCAGVGTAARIVNREGELSIDAFEKTLRVNLVGTFVVMSIAAREIAKLDPVNDDGERGVVINTSSLAWQDGQIGQSAYAASKGGVASMTLPAARELARSGIRVMAIAPGLFSTAMTDGLPENIRASIAANIPFPSRLGHATEYAALAEQIVRNTMLNGTVIRLDGAVRLQPK